MVIALPAHRTPAAAPGTTPAAVLRLINPAALRAARTAVDERARILAASPEQTRHAKAVVLRELSAGRSPAVVIALACGALTGRRNALLGSPVGA